MHLKAANQCFQAAAVIKWEEAACRKEVIYVLWGGTQTAAFCSSGVEEMAALLQQDHDVFESFPDILLSLSGKQRPSHL